MKVGLLTCFDENYKEIFDATKKSKAKYCRDFGIDFLVFKYHLKDRTQHWGRILGIKKYLTQYDYLVYLDTDTAIINYKFDIRTLIDDDFNIITGPLPHQGHIGTNGLIIKNCEWSYKYLDIWWDQKRFIDEPYYGSPSCGTTDDGGLSIPPSKWIFYEQSAFHFLYDEDIEFRSKVKLVDRQYMHSVSKTFCKDHFLIHVPGMDKKEKLRCLKQFCMKL